MKLHVLYDRAGRILAAVHLDAPVEPGQPRIGELRPVPRRGETAADFNVPPEYASRDFVEVCAALRVDPKRRVLVPAERRPRGVKRRSTSGNTRK